MVSNSAGARMVGRPIVLQEDDIFHAVYRVMTKLGPGRITIAAIAREVGSSGPALIKRFGSKRGLMLAFTQWAVQRSRETIRNSPRDYASPLGALRAWLLFPESLVSHDAIEIHEYSNIVQFYFEEAMDTELRELWGQWTDDYEQEVIRFLDEAVVAGELRADCDTARLGHALHAAVTGIVVLWFGHPERSSRKRLQEIYQVIIEPYLSE